MLSLVHHAHLHLQMKMTMECITVGEDGIQRKPGGVAYQVMQRVEL